MNMPNFVRIGIIIPMLLIKPFFYTQQKVYLSAQKYEHMSVGESIDSGDTNLSSVGTAE